MKMTELSQQRIREMESLKINVKPSIDIKGPPNNYKNDADPKGVILITNIYSILNSNEYDYRWGSRHDVDNLEILYTQIGYEAEVFLGKGIGNPTKLEINKKLQNLSNDRRLREFDSIILAFMSHGKDNYFKTSDDKNMTVREVCDYLKNCPYLKGKAKLVIFVMCRTESENSTQSNTHLDPGKRARIPDRKGESDMFVLYSTGEGEKSTRTKIGTYYVHHMCKVFMEKAWENELEALMLDVNTGLEKDLNIGCQTMYPHTEKKFYFNPIKRNTDSENNGGDIGDDDNATDNHNNSSTNDEENDADHDNDNSYGDDNENNDNHSNDNAGNVDGTKDNETPESTSSRKTHVLMIDNLNGCGEDMNILKKLFKDMDYEVMFCDNVDFNNLKVKINQFKDISHGDSAFIVFYGDGFADHILTSDHVVIHINDLRKQFNDINCPNLKGVPKVFIMNVCYFDDEEKLKWEDNYESDKDALLECDENKTASAIPDITEEDNYESDNDALLESDDNKTASAIPDITEDKNFVVDNNYIFLNVETERRFCERGSLLTNALDYVLRENKSEKLISIVHSVKRRICALQTGRKPDYICELHDIKFTSDLCINPILKLRENPQTLNSHLQLEEGLPECSQKQSQDINKSPIEVLATRVGVLSDAGGSITHTVSPSQSTSYSSSVGKRESQNISDRTRSKQQRTEIEKYLERIYKTGVGMLSVAEASASISSTLSSSQSTSYSASVGKRKSENISDRTRSKRQHTGAAIQHEELEDLKEMFIDLPKQQKKVTLTDKDIDEIITTVQSTSFEKLITTEQSTSTEEATLTDKDIDELMTIVQSTSTEIGVTSKPVNESRPLGTKLGHTSRRKVPLYAQDEPVNKEEKKRWRRAKNAHCHYTRHKNRIEENTKVMNILREEILRLKKENTKTTKEIDEALEVQSTSTEIGVTSKPVAEASPLRTKLGHTSRGKAPLYLQPEPMNEHEKKKWQSKINAFELRMKKQKQIDDQDREINELKREIEELEVQKIMRNTDRNLKI